MSEKKTKNFLISEKKSTSSRQENFYDCNFLSNIFFFEAKNNINCTERVENKYFNNISQLKKLKC